MNVAADGVVHGRAVVPAPRRPVDAARPVRPSGAGSPTPRWGTGADRPGTAPTVPAERAVPARWTAAGPARASAGTGRRPAPDGTGRRAASAGPVTEDAFATLLRRTADVTTLGAFLLATGVGVLSRYAHLGVPVSFVPLVLWAAGAALSALALVRLSGVRDGPARRLDGAGFGVALLTHFVCLGGLVTAGGGAGGPFWVLALPVTLLVSVALPVRTALVVGALASTTIAVGTATALAGGATATTPWLLVVLPVPVLLAGMVSSAARSVRRTTEALQADRLSLRAGTEPLLARFTAMADGDLRTPVPLDEDGPAAAAQLSRALDEMRRGVLELATRMRTRAEDLGGATTRLRAASEQQGVSATEQGAAVQDAVARVRDLADAADVIAEHAQGVHEVASGALAAAEDGRHAVRGAMAALERIDGRVAATTSRAASLGQRSAEIDRILEVLEDLVDQTDLLALNAAIEASRAGEHGRGFAVVAAAVRELAERAAASTTQISALVGEVRELIDATLQETAAGSVAVARSVELGRGAVETLGAVVDLVGESASAAQQIGVATRQQRAATQQLVLAVSEVDAVSSRAAEVAGYSAAAAGRLDALGTRLAHAAARVAG